MSLCEAMHSLRGSSSNCASAYRDILRQWAAAHQRQIIGFLAIDGVTYPNQLVGGLEPACVSVCEDCVQYRVAKCAVMRTVVPSHTSLATGAGASMLTQDGIRRGMLAIKHNDNESEIECGVVFRSGFE